jgi:signal transduction histidine kinase/ligand-binding sensor domain-containing protein
MAGTLKLIAWIFVSCLLSLLMCPPASALDPNRKISQYGHTAWRTQDGFVNAPNAIAQTADGYIWIAMADGLVRFDGVKFSHWIPPQGQSLPGIRPRELLGARDGSLWIGTSGGLSRLKDGELINYKDSGGAGIGGILEDHTGTIWVTRYSINDEKGPLCQVIGEDLNCYGEKDGIPTRFGLGLAEDSAGNIWFGSDKICRWSPDSTSVYSEKGWKNFGDIVVGRLAASPSGEVWAALDGTGPNMGLRYYSDGKWPSYMLPGLNGTNVRARAMFVDHNQTLWFGTLSDGLYRIHDGIVDHYGIVNGLSGISVESIFEDREGNLWITTDNGFDLFRDTPVLTFSTSEGLSTTGTSSLLALRDGSIWVGEDGGVQIIHSDGAISAVTAGHGLPGQDPQAMLEDSTGRVWLGIDDTLMIYDHGRFFDVKKSDGSALGHIGTARSITEDADANVWAVISSGRQRRLIRIKDEHVIEDIPLNSIPGIPGADFVAADKVSGVWIGLPRHNLARYHDGHLEVVPLGNTENEPQIYQLVDFDDAVWGATSKGLYRWKDGSLSVLDSRNNLPCSAIFAALKDNLGSLWLYAQCGLLKVPASDLTNWLNSPESKVAVETFDLLDGAQPSMGVAMRPPAAKSPDGRLWFATNSFIQMIDPSRSYANAVPPPVYIEGLVSDHQSYDTKGNLSLPPLRSELQIDYTALNFAVPQKVRFRYKLEGHDSDWHEPGTRRQAFYTDLRPGSYTFRVIACNNNGVWNTTGATLTFRVMPAWYQTNWFLLLCIVSGLLLVWVVYNLRVRQIARAISVRFDERLAERTRIARELHDTLLQTVQGSKLVADDALEKSDDSAHMRHAMKQLSGWLGQATQEGRAALNSLRTTTIETNDLAAGLRRATEECLLDKSMAVKFSVAGGPRNMHPIARDEIYRIGYEAIRNACEHASASELEVSLDYAQDLTLRVNDNGVGIDPAVIEGGKEGHFGLRGMRERAERIGSKLTLNSSPHSGTEMTLVVPGNNIFQKARATRFERIKTSLGRRNRASEQN